MKILIVSGFLGAGKTTFIKELIRRTHIRPVILENEYGENNIDALDLRAARPAGEELKILEFMEGCVCCTMKDSFVNSVLTIYAGLAPEYLIVEPTGVGKLSNILKNLKPILHGEISLLQPLVVLSPRAFRQNMSEWPQLYRDQVRNAQTVVFSKCEHTPVELLDDTAANILKINPAAQIVRQHYSAQEESWWRSLVDLPAHEEVSEAEDRGGGAMSQLSLDHAWLHNPAELVQVLEDCLHSEFGHVARAKGTVPAGNEMLRFDLADGLYAVSGTEAETSQCVFIGLRLNKAKLCRRMGTTLLKEGFSPANANPRGRRSLRKIIANRSGPTKKQG